MVKFVPHILIKRIFMFIYGRFLSCLVLGFFLSLNTFAKNDAKIMKVFVAEFSEPLVSVVPVSKRQAEQLRGDAHLTLNKKMFLSTPF